MTTYRERRADRADRLRAWADKREHNARATLAADDALPYAHDIAFLTQPGRIIERERMNARADRAYRSLDKADEMAARAAEIDRQADRAIYSDDPDAAERLAAKIAELEERRAAIGRYNASARAAAKVGGIGDLSLLPEDLRGEPALLARVAPYQLRPGAGLPAYLASNLGGQIVKARERLAMLSRPRLAPALRVISARRAGTCDDCGRPIAAGDPISPAPDGSRVWIHTACAQGTTQTD